MVLLIHLFFVAYLAFNSHVWANPENVTDGRKNQWTDCDPIECQQLRDRLEIVEAAIRSLLVALSSQKKGQVLPISKIIEHDSALQAILSPSAVKIPPKNVTLPSDEAAKTQEKNAVHYLKGALKCSLAHLLDVNYPATGANPSGNITAILDKNNALQIEWTPSSIECLKFSSGVWIRVSEAGSKQDLSSSTKLYLEIPHKCLKRRANASFSIVLPPSTAMTRPQNTCHFHLPETLIQCRAYTVEVVPNYQSLMGKVLFTKIENTSTIMASNFNAFTNSNSLSLAWRDNSGCAAQLSSIRLNIFPDKVLDVSDTNSSVKIRRSCFTNVDRMLHNDQLFSLTLSIQQACPDEWKPLDACRSYKVDLTSEYSEAWTSGTSPLEMFTTQHGMFPDNPFVWYCNRGYFYCNSSKPENQHTCWRNDYLCDEESETDCDLAIHMNCDRRCLQGFRCGVQCISTDQVCDEKYDCFDGSDEHYDCDYARSCDQLTESFGQISSIMRTPSNMVKPENFIRAVQKTIVSIVVQPNHTVWLSFNKFYTLEAHPLIAYDGPYSTSPLLLRHSGSTMPPSIRSSSNTLYMEFPSYYYDQNYGIDVFYTSIPSSGKPFTPGCGGYIYDNGTVFAPNLFHDQTTECVWFLEARQNGHAIFLTRNYTVSANQPTITVRDGWSLSGEVLFDEQISVERRMAVHSITNKITVQFRPPIVIADSSSFYWNVSSISTTQCEKHLVGLSGTIKSSNYPAFYPNSSDCRWAISTPADTKILLLFLSVETEGGHDYIYVYDGPTHHFPAPS